MGGYPLAYLNLSKDTGLLDGFDGCNDITRNEMMVLLFRAGFIDKMEVANFKNESLEFNNKNSGSLFEENWDVYDYSGVLKNSGVITLDDSIKTSDGRTVFDNVSYKNNGIDTEKYLGRYVRLITRETDDEDKLIYIIADENRNEETVIDADDFIGYSNHTVRYYDDEKERKYNVDTAATVLLNGDIVKYDIESAMKIAKGEITLIDSNMDDVADTVIINSFKSCIVGYVDAGNELVYDKRSKSVIANADIYDCVRIHNDVDTEMSLSEITAGMIISVRKGEKLLDITVSTQSASGTLAAVKSDTKEYKFEIDGKDYIIDDDLLNDTTWFNDKTFIGKIGSDYTLYMDCFGYVVELKAGAASSGMYGYIVKYAPDTKMGDTLCMKLFTSEGEMKIFECAAKVMVDGVAQKQIQSIINAIELGDKELIFFRTDSEGKISYIDTSYHNPDAESENTLSVSAEKKNRNAKAENASLDGDIRPSSSTVKFIVPDDVTTGKDKYYSISSGCGYSEDQTAITKAYKIDKDHIMCDVLIEYRQSNYTPDFKLKLAFVVNRIYRGLNSDGDAAWQVEGYLRGAKKVYTFASDVMDKFENLASNAQISGIEDIEPGDILRVAANDFGEIFAFQLFVDYSEGLDTVPKW